MTKRLVDPYRRAAFKGVLFQGSVATIAAVLVLIGWGVTPGLSTWFGGLSVVLPNLVFAAYAFRYMGASKSEQVLDSIKKGKALKFLLTVCMFVVAFKYLALLPIPYFSAFVLIFATQWIAPIFFNH